MSGLRRSGPDTPEHRAINDVARELRQRGYAVAVITPKELIDTIEVSNIPVEDFDSSEWMIEHREAVEKWMKEAARILIVRSLTKETRQKNGC